MGAFPIGQSTTRLSNRNFTSRLCIPKVFTTPHCNDAAPVTGPPPGLLDPLPNPRFARHIFPRALAASRPAALCIHPFLSLRQQRRIQQEHSQRSWPVFRQRKDSRSRSEGSTCARNGARGVQWWTDTGRDNVTAEGEK